MSLPGSILLILVPALLAGCQAIPSPGTRLSGQIGANAVGDGEIDDRNAPPGESAERDVEAAPSILFVVERPLAGTRALNVGIEFGGSLTFWPDGVRWYAESGSGGTVVIVDFDNRFWLGELFLGPYASALIGDRVRIFAGAGGVLTAAGFDYETVPGNDTGDPEPDEGWDSDVGFGVHARAGLEFRVADGQYVGIAARYMRTEFELDDVGARFDLATLQILATFTVEY